DFDQGITLLRQVNRNQYYIRNIERSRRISTLVYELGRVLQKKGIAVPKAKVTSEKAKRESEKAKNPSVDTIPIRILPLDMGRVLAGGSNGEEQQRAKGKEHGAIVLRDQFPFLGEEGCPDELK